MTAGRGRSPFDEYPPRGGAQPYTRTRSNILVSKDCFSSTGKYHHLIPMTVRSNVNRMTIVAISCGVPPRFLATARVSLVRTLTIVRYVYPCFFRANESMGFLR